MRAFLVAALLVLVPALAQAQHPPSATEVALARQQFDEGVQHAQAGRWDQAVAAFQRSYDVAPRAVTLLNLAAAQVQTHHFVAATESYRRYLATATDHDLSRYRTQAESALADAQTHIGRATVRADGLLESDSVTVDGEALPRAAVGIPMPLDPGDHVATVRRNDTEVARRAFTLADAGTANVALDVPAPSAAEVANASVGHDGSGNAVGGDVYPRRHDGGGPDVGLIVGVIIGVLVVAAAIIIPVVVLSSSSASPFDGNTMPGMIVVP